MPLDPQVKASLEQTAALGLPPYHELTPTEARAQMDALRAAIPGEPVARVNDRTIPGPGGALPIRVYTPDGVGPFPALVFFHGGGWVVGSIAGSDHTCRALANRARCVVVSVEYRLAPEHVFPAAADDCYAATAWVADHASSIDADPVRIAVGGVSAGGNLAAAVTLMARDRSGPALAYQLLVVPVTDATRATASYRDNGDGYGLTSRSMDWFWDHYAPDPEAARSPYASPLLAEDHANLPPALVITAEYDPLRDEGHAYAERLRAAGVPVRETCYPGMVHGFFGMANVLDGGQRAVDEAGAALRDALAD